MFARTFKEALEDAHGVILEFSSKPVRGDDCEPAVRQAIDSLDAALQHALERAEDRDTIPMAAQREVDERALALLMLWSKCGERTQALMLDLKTVLGKYVTLAPAGGDGGSAEKVTSRPESNTRDGSDRP